MPLAKKHGDHPSCTSTREPYPAFTDKYDVERIIGRGGMGTVFEARHKRLGHRVAIKILGDELRVHPELVRRFEREARAAGALTSPHAVRVYDIDQTDDGTPFMVMELLHGRDLSHLIEQDGPQPVGMAVRFIIEACDAIAEAHRLGIVHRDIKPSNLLLCGDTGAIKVLDFGIAKRVAAKEAAITLGVAPLGTPQYMSPEQVRCAKDVDGRSDIWSLGVTLYELITGRPPFNHEIAQACVASIVADPIPDPREFKPDLPADLVAVIMRALAKDPEERFQTVGEFVLALEPFADTTSDSGSWRVITGARRMALKEQPTLDGNDLLLDDEEAEEEEDLVIPLRVQPKADVPITKQRGRFPSFETVPPLIGARESLAASRGKRIRSSLAFASAAVLGLAALVATPKCVGSKIDSATAASKSATLGQESSATSVVVVARTAKAPIAVATPTDEITEQPAAPSATSSSSEEAASPGTSSTTAPKSSSKSSTANPKPSATATATTATTRPANVAFSSAPVRVIGTDRPIHGGISSPGF